MKSNPNSVILAHDASRITSLKNMKKNKNSLLLIQDLEKQGENWFRF